MCSKISHFVPVSLLTSTILQQNRSGQAFTGKTNFRATGHGKCLHSVTQTHFSMRLTPSSTMFTVSGAPQREVLCTLRIWQARFKNTTLIVSSESNLAGKGTGYGSLRSLVQTVRATVVLSISLSLSRKPAMHDGPDGAISRPPHLCDTGSASLAAKPQATFLGDWSGFGESSAQWHNGLKISLILAKTLERSVLLT